MKKQVSLSELALEMGVNKSKLLYYAKQGLIKPISIVGRMYIFDYDKTYEAVLNIDKMKIDKVKLKDIKKMK